MPSNHDDNLSYAEILEQAGTAAAGSDGLFFLPFLMGERLGNHRNSRAQFFGLSASNRLPQMHRAVLEGVGFAGHDQDCWLASAVSPTHVLDNTGYTFLPV